MPLSSVPGLILPGQRTIIGTRTPPSHVVIFSERNGVVPAVRRLYERTGLGPDDFEVVECNEAFAGQILACLDEIGIPDERNCVQGGALALGHPWAATGAVLLTRIFTQLVREGRGGRGLAAIAIAGGMGAAIAVEAC